MGVGVRHFGSTALFGRSHFVPFFDGDDGDGNNADGSGNSGNANKPITFQNQADLDNFLKKRLDRAKDSWEKEAKKELKKEVEQEVKDELTAEEAKEQGKFEDLYNAEIKKVEKLERDIQDLKNEAAERDRKELRRTVAAKHKIPDELVDRIQGDTEEEMTADAKTLAKALKLQAEEDESEGNESKKSKVTSQRRPIVDTDAGKGKTKPVTGERENSGNSNGTGKKTTGYAFVKEGDVSWG